MSPQKCQDLIEFSEQKTYRPATVTMGDSRRLLSGTRNNDRLILEYAPMAERLFSKLISGLPEIDGMRATGLNARFRFYRYGVGQRFKRHRDGRVNIDGSESRLTFMVYLNNDFEGGATKFDDVTIHPNEGMALLFIHELKHESLPITDGQKYVLRSDVYYA